jgi:flagellar protein FliS
VALCYERLVSALGSALFAHDKGDNRAKSEALTRAISALTALQMGVVSGEGVAGALAQFYEAARRGVLDNVVDFDPQAVARIRADVAEIAAALTQS